MSNKKSLTRSKMIAFIKRKDPFLQFADLSGHNNEELKNLYTLLKKALNSTGPLKKSHKTGK